MINKIEKLAKNLWGYHHINQKIQKSDLIICLGSNDIKVAERAVELYKKKYVKKILFSGGFGKITKSKFRKPESHIFSDIALIKGVKKIDIIIEDKSTNSGENILFSYKLIQKLNLKKIIFVTKPTMERRIYTTISKQWPDKNTKIFITSPQFAFKDYFKNKKERNELINIMVCDLERIIIYPKKGFQIIQCIPKNVLKAYHELINLGFTKYLIK